jgi:hypothetical protein
VSAIQQDLQLDNMPIVRLESPELRVDVAPSVGGRVVSIVHKRRGYEFLWRNSALPLELKRAGTDYDPNFYGGIDELLPNDVAETIQGVACPDHGELWTTSLRAEVEKDRLILKGVLSAYGLKYERQMRLSDQRPCLLFHYRISNMTNQPRPFLWKLHAALAIQEGDEIECPAETGQIVDPSWSRYRTTAPFKWPNLEGHRVNVIPAKDGTMDFFYLSNLHKGELYWHRPDAGLKFGYEFDTRVFPYAWLFATWGGFLEHYTAILEPCTTTPMSVNEALPKGQCSVLGPGETLETEVTLYAGPA